MCIFSLPSSGSPYSGKCLCTPYHICYGVARTLPAHIRPTSYTGGPLTQKLRVNTIIRIGDIFPLLRISYPLLSFFSHSSQKKALGALAMLRWCRPSR